MPRLDKNSDDQIVEGKVFAILAYLSILCIIPLLLKKDNDFVLSHGRQGLVIFVAEVAVFVIHIILGTWILKLGGFILGAVSLLGILAVLQGKYIRIPCISEIAEKITL
ncbi:MAG: hypothetical protein WC552_00080 [Candidatus Omnitrophota bacterium]